MDRATLPVQPGERVAEIDLIRGIALLGIFIMNMPGFDLSFASGADGSHAFAAWYDRGVEEFREVLLSGKFNSMFSFLFAVGFTIQLGRLQAAEPAHALGTYLRRLAILFLFGVVHAVVFWIGDVLHVYALLGLLLLAVHRLPDRAIVATLVATLLIPTVGGIVTLPLMTTDYLAHGQALMQSTEIADNRIYGHGSFAAGVRQNIEWLRLFYVQDGIAVWDAVKMYLLFFSTMLLGLLVGRHGWYKDIGRFAPQLRRIQWASLALGLVTAGLVLIGRLHADPSHVRPYDFVSGASYRLCRIALMAFYVTSALRLYLRPGWAARLAPIANAGRMPLTNYLMQTMMAIAIFRGWGLGYWGEAGPLASLLLAVGLYAVVQLPLSGWWLRRYRYGPLEGLWRALTYGRWPRMRLAQAPAASAPA
jgi:uncharacterized protein